MISRRRFLTGVATALAPMGAAAHAQEYKAQRAGKAVRTVEEKKYVAMSPALAQGLSNYLLARGLPDPSEPLLLSESAGRAVDPRGAHPGRDSARPAGGHSAAVGLGPQTAAQRQRAGPLRQARSPHPERLTDAGSPRALERYDHLIPGELHEARQKQQEALARYLGRRPPPA